MQTVPTFRQRPFGLRLLLVLAGCSWIFIPSAHASIITQGFHLVIGPNASQTVSFDPLANGDVDVTLSASGSAPADLPILLGISGFPVTTFDLGPLAYGTPITLADNTAPGDNLVYGSADPNPPPDVDYSGTWANQVGPAYIGATFTANSQQYLAWVELEMDAPAGTMTLLGYGYNDVAASQPGGSLFAGQTPEPSSLALVLLGAAVLLFCRRARYSRA